MKRSTATLLFIVSAMTSVSAAQAQTVNFSGVELRTNAGTNSTAPTMDGVRLQMMNGVYEQSKSAISTTTFNLFGAWSTSYRLSFNCTGVPENPNPFPDDPEPSPEVICPGDGIGFVVTDGADTQVGTGGFGLGYEGSFAKSVTFGMKSFWNLADFGTNGAWTKDCCSDPKLFASSDGFLDDFDVLLSYDGLAQLTASVTRVSDNTNIFNESFAWTLTGNEWTQNARVGFTSASGLAAENSYVSNWTIQQASTTVPEPSSVALMASGLFGLAFAAHRRRKAVRA